MYQADTIRKEGTKGAIVNGTELKDSTTAVVRGGTEGTTLTAGRNVEVVSGDSLSAYMASGTLAAGLYSETCLTDVVKVWHQIKFHTFHCTVKCHRMNCQHND